MADGPPMPPAYLLDAFDLLDAGDPDTAIVLIQDALADPDALPADLLALAVESLGDAFGQSGRPDDAITAYRRAQQLHRDQGAPGPAASCGVEIGRCLLRTDRPIDAARELDGLRDHLLDPAELADCTWLLGSALAGSDRDEDAVAPFTEAAELFDRLAEPVPAALCRLELADLHETAGRSAAAADAYRAAWPVFVAAEMDAEAYACARGVADALIDLEQPGDAREAMLAARQAALTAGAGLDAAQCLAYLGLLASDTGRPEDARDALTAARDEFAALHEAGQAAHCDDDLADILVELDDEPGATAALLAAVAGHRSAGNVAAAADCGRRLGLLCQRTGFAVDAVDAWAAASIDYTDAGDRDTAAALDFLRAVALGDLGRYPEADAAYLAARRHLAGHGTPEELAECDAQRAGTLIDAGRSADAEPLLHSSRRSFTLAGNASGVAICDRHFGTYYRSRGDFPLAVTALTAAIESRRTDPDAAEFVADCRAELGITHLLADRYPEALRAFDAADRHYRQHGLELKRAAILQGLGHHEYLIGALARSEVTFVAAQQIYRDHRHEYAAAVVDSHLALVYQHLSRWDETEAALVRVRAAANSAGDHVRAAMADANLGCLYVTTGDFPRAETLLRSAATTLTPHHPDHAAQCRQNLGALYALQHRYPDAEREMISSAAVYGHRPEFDSQNALALCNLGAVQMMDRRFGDAQQSLTAARRLFLRLGATTQVARCDVLIAGVGFAEDGGNARRALDRALPAVLYLDAQRFQFSTSRDRLGWNTTAAKFTSIVFDWAAQLGDDTLLAELVESTVNAGIHTAGSGTDADDPLTAVAESILTDTVAATQSTPPPTIGSPTVAVERHSTTPGSTLSAAGAAGLIQDPRLPMLPPPRLTLPGGRLALALHIDTAEKNYGTVRGPEVVWVW